MGRIGKSDDAADAKNLRKYGMQCRSQRGIEEMISDIERQPVDDAVSDDAASEEYVVGEHGRGTSHEYVGECRAGVGGERRAQERVEPVHGVGFVGSVPDDHGALDGHEDADDFGGVGKIHGDEMK